MCVTNGRRVWGNVCVSTVGQEFKSAIKSCKYKINKVHNIIHPPNFYQVRKIKKSLQNNLENIIKLA